MAAKKNKTIVGQARKALVLRQITGNEFGRIVYGLRGLPSDLFIMDGALWRGFPLRPVRRLKTGDR